jgi:hypothetical protein
VATVKITGQGLTAIAILVGLLWACLIAERLVAAGARREAAAEMQILNRMRRERHLSPASGPHRGEQFGVTHATL